MTYFIIGFITGLLGGFIFHEVWKYSDDQYFQGYMQAVDDANRALRKLFDEHEKQKEGEDDAK